MTPPMPSLCLLACFIAAAACSRAEAPPGPAASNAAEAAAARPVLTVSTDMQKKWGIRVGRAARLTVSSTITLPGTVSLNQKRTAHISPLVDGKVVEVRADLGDTVRRNQVLVVIHSPAFAQAQIAFLQAHARLDLARTELDRAKELLREEAIQQKEYLRREAEFRAATTECGLQESNLHSLGLDHPRLDALVKRAGGPNADLSDLAEPTLDVVSPIDGRIIFRDLVIGEHVHPDKILFTASDLTTVWAFLDAREKDLPFISRSSTIAIQCPVYPGRAFAGRGVQTSDIVDEKLRTIKVRVEVENAGLLLKPNMYIQGVVDTTAGSRQVLAVPEDAIQTIDGTPVVFVAERPDTFAAWPVEVGDRIGTHREITKGLDGSEAIVLVGAFTLKSERMKSTLGGE